MPNAPGSPTKGPGCLPRVLFVDDDSDLLETIAMQLRTQFEVLTAASGSQGMAMIATEKPFAVIVSDMEMEGMNGIEFLKLAHCSSPDSVRVMMTARNDLEVAAAAVNHGNVFRFVLKPFRSSEMLLVLNQCVGQYRLVTAERELLEQTLVNSIQMLVDILALISPIAFGRANRIRSYAKQIAEASRLNPMWEIELSGLLCQIGCITIPSATLAKVLSGDELSTEESQSFGSLHEVSATLINHIPRFERISRIIGLTGEAPSQTDLEAGRTSLPFELSVAGILRASMDFDSLVSRGSNKSRAIADMLKRRGQYFPWVMEAIAGLEAISIDRRMTVVKSCELNSTMTIRENLYAKNRHLVVGKDQQVTKSMRELIKSYVQRGILDDAISVYLPAEKQRVKVGEIIPGRLSQIPK